MSFVYEVTDLVKKEFLQEWRSKHFLNSILLYVASTIFVCYLSFKVIDSTIWNVLFWIIMLFISINAISKTFSQENQSRQLYYYTLVSPEAIIISKIIYNVVLMLFLAFVALSFYMLVFRAPIQNLGMYLCAVCFGSVSLASTFTMVAAIAAKANQNATLMAILGFPIIVPLLIVLIKLSRFAVTGIAINGIGYELIVLSAINLIVLVVSLLLFPYLWRD